MTIVSSTSDRKTSEMSNEFVANMSGFFLRRSGGDICTTGARVKTITS